MKKDLNIAINNLLSVIEQHFPREYFPTKPIARGNPYDCCKYCDVSVPEINSKLHNHEDYCLYRKIREAAEEVEIYILDET